MTAVCRGVGQAWSAYDLRAGMCAAALIKAVGHQNDMLDSLQIFQTTWDSAASQRVSAAAPL